MVEVRNLAALLREKGLASGPPVARASVAPAQSKKIIREQSEAFDGAIQHTDAQMLQFMENLSYQILGSRVASPSHDRYNNWNRIGLTNDSQLLYAAYMKVREMFSETTLDAANKRLTRAVGKGFSHEFSAVVQSDEARACAKWANDLTKHVAEMIIGTGWAGGCTDYKKGQARPITIADISEQLGRYCNYPLILEFWKTGGLRKLRPMPPFTWVINSDENFDWIDPDCAFIQYDPATGQEVGSTKDVYADDGQTKVKKVTTGRVPTDNMVWLSANHDPDQRYGFPFAYNGAVFVDSFRALVDGLEEARDNANPEKVYLTPGKDGRGFSEDEREKIKNSFPDKSRDRGKKMRAFDFYRILNGVSDAKVLSVGTDYFNQLGDANLFRQHIAMIYGISIAIVLGDAKFNRATLELLLRMEAGAQRLWAAHLTSVGIFQIFQRVLDQANIPTHLITCEVEWKEESTPEEAAAKAAFAKEGWLDGLFSEETAHIKGCNYIGVNPKTDKERKEKEKADGKQIPQQTRQTLRISGLNPNQPLQLPGGTGPQLSQTEADEDSEQIN
jgi:hypothetical protein